MRIVLFGATAAATALLAAPALAAPGDTSLLSRSTAGASANRAASQPSVSADGRYVAYSSEASNLVVGDRTNDCSFGGGLDGTGAPRSCSDAFVFDRQSNTTVLVSRNTAGQQANADSSALDISDSGRFVLFSSRASNLVPGDDDTLAQSDLFVRDRDTDGNGVFDEPGTVSTVQANVSDSGAPDLSDGRTDSLFSAALSGDGTRVVFSTVGRLAAGDSGSRTDVYVRDFAAGSTTLVSATAGGQSSNGTDELPTISADGNRVAWWSKATNLAPGDTNRRSDVLVRDLSTGTITQASVRNNGAQSNGPVNPVAAPALDADGSTVVFASGARNLVAGDTNGREDVFVRDLDAATTVRANVSSTGAQANNGDQYLRLYGYDVSGDGTRVVFEDQATNLVAGDTNGLQDVFLRDLATKTTTRVSVTSTGQQATGQFLDSSAPAISGDGRVTAFSSTADLVPGTRAPGSQFRYIFGHEN